MPLSSDLEIALRDLAAAGPVDLRHNGARIAPLSSLSWEVRGSSDKPLLHVWSENHNFTHRVLAITDNSEQRLILAVECFGRAKPDRLEFLRTEFDRSPIELSRQAFAQSIQRCCEQQFPDDTLESLTTAADLENSLSGNYVRGVLRRNRESWALFAVPEGPETQDPARSLTFALLWFDHLMQTADRRLLSGIRMLLPPRTAAPLARLLAVLRADVRVQLFERDPVLEILRRIEPSEVANAASWIVPLRDAQALVQRAGQDLNRLLPANAAGFSFHANVAAAEVVVRFRGLSCMRWHDCAIHFGARDLRRRFVEGREKEVHAMFRELENYRNPLASDVRHPLFRAQPERWLEFLLREDVSRADAMLDAQFAYGQVLAGVGGEHGIIDILSVTRSGRLAILELKATEDPVFLLQAASYWLLIKRHLEQNDFSRHGYFPGMTFQPQPPLIYLVAPALRFHPATGALLRYLHPQLEVIRVGLAESWRRGLNVVLRQ